MRIRINVKERTRVFTEADLEKEKNIKNNLFCMFLSSSPDIFEDMIWRRRLLLSTTVFLIEIRYTSMRIQLQSSRRGSRPEKVDNSSFSVQR
jgi:hypothetical protein